MFKMVDHKEENSKNGWKCTKWYTFRAHVQIDIQRRTKRYTFMYKMLYKNVHNESQFQKILQFGIQKFKTWSTRIFFLIDVKFTKWYTLSAYMYKLK